MSFFSVRDFEANIHELLFEIGTTPVMQATSETDVTQQPEQINPQLVLGGSGQQNSHLN